MSEKKKFKIKMPHLLFLMLGLIIFMSLLTYVIPAGNFGTTADGKIDSTVFNFLPEQTPVPVNEAFMRILDGLTGAALIGWLVIVSGAAIQVFLDSGCIDDFLNWSLYKLQDKGANVLIPAMFALMVYLGAFGGSDAMIAVVPIGVMFSKKLRLDPIVALGVTLFATMIGFGTGPTKLMIPQLMIGVPLYSGFGMRMIIMNVFMLVGIAYLMRYVKKIQKDPTKSVVGDTSWLEGAGVDEEALEAPTMSARTVITLLLFVAMYVTVVMYTVRGAKIEGSRPYHFQTACFIAFPILAGIVHGFSLDEIGNSFAKGAASMAFVSMAIGLAGVVSIVMNQGNIIHTIVYYLTQPLLAIGQQFASVFMTIIIAIINPIIPSASSKAAILVPIISPIADAIGLTPQLAVQAFQFGDGFTNLISPLLGWTVGSVTMAGLSFDKWLKWVLPIVIIFLLLSFIFMYILTGMGWTGI